MARFTNSPAYCNGFTDAAESGLYRDGHFHRRTYMILCPECDAVTPAQHQYHRGWMSSMRLGAPARPAWHLWLRRCAAAIVQIERRLDAAMFPRGRQEA